MLFSDACPGGLGGYSVTIGLAWQFNLAGLNIDPRVSNNLLEIIGAVVQIWFTIAFDPDCPPLSCLLAWTDNSSGAGWLHKSNFDERGDRLHDAIARKFATVLLDHSCMVFPQHIQGEQNSVADCLSRRFDLTPTQIESHILSSHPEQVPTNFQVAPLPNEISSWIFSTVTRPSESTIQKPRGHTKSTTEPGTGGHSSSPKSASLMTHSSTSHQPSSAASYTHASSNAANATTSPTPNADSNWIENIRHRYSEGLSKKPLGTWLRNSGILGGLAPFTMMSAPTNCSLPLQASSKHGKTPTLPRSDKKP